MSSPHSCCFASHVGATGWESSVGGRAAAAESIFAAVSRSTTVSFPGPSSAGLRASGVESAPAVAGAEATSNSRHPTDDAAAALLSSMIAS